MHIVIAPSCLTHTEPPTDAVVEGRNKDDVACLEHMHGRVYQPGPY